MTKLQEKIDEVAFNELLPPLAYSLTHDIDLISKPSILEVLDTSLASDNTIKFNGRFAGKHQVDVTSVLHLAESQSPKLSMTEDISLTFKNLTGAPAYKFQIHGNKVLMHLDLGYSRLKFKFLDTTIRAWIDPYVIIDTNRFFNKFYLGFGFLGSIPHIEHTNVRLLLYNNHYQFQADFIMNTAFKYRKIFVNSLLRNSVFDPLVFTTRNLMAGLDFGRFVAAVHIENNKKASVFSTHIDNIRLLFGFDFDRQGKIALECFRERTTSNSTRFSLAHQFMATRNLLFKNKIDSDLTASSFLDYSLTNTFGIQASAQADIRALKSESGVIASSFSFGLRLILNN
jgi:hypothetical protein